MDLLQRSEHLLDLRRLELFERLGFNLANAFASDGESLSYLFERTRVILADAEAQSNDRLFPRTQCVEDAIHFPCHFTSIDVRVRRYRLLIR